MSFSKHPEITISLYHDEDPYAIRIIKSGWSKPDLYHVIEEFGDMDLSEYKGTFTSNQIKDKWGIDVEIEENSLRSIIRKLPNDADLGVQIRKTVNTYIHE
jgi:hypothetical protein